MMKKVFKKVMKLTPVTLLNMLALMLVVENVSAACAWYVYQPEVPESAKRFIKE